ncbi:MAG: DUF2489 domain-containing protein [Oceanospirillaceae bacterium]
MIYLSIVTGLFFIIALSLYIYRHLKNARKEQLRQQKILDTHLEKHQARQEYVSSSINIIVTALAGAQIEVVEASIRLKVLIDQLRPNIAENSFPSIELVFEKTKHIPKLKAWKSLDKQQRKQFSKEMNNLEADFSEQIRAEVKQLGEMMEQRK